MRLFRGAFIEYSDMVAISSFLSDRFEFIFNLKSFTFPGVISNLLEIPAFFELQSILVMAFGLVFLSRNKYYA